MTDLGRIYSENDWAMQLHLSAMRNNSTRKFGEYGADSGFDSMDDPLVARNLSRLLDAMDRDGRLPRTILYSLNPKDNYTLASLLGNFQASGVPGKIQLGSGWWFNDQLPGMIDQMTTLASVGLLGRFVGMLTDSRSFISYPRHEYFRRILCNLIGSWVENGEFPDDPKLLTRIVQGVSYENAKAYFRF
jgi:glucuronate isomerase